MCLALQVSLTTKQKTECVNHSSDDSIQERNLQVKERNACIFIQSTIKLYSTGGVSS